MFARLTSAVFSKQEISVSEVKDCEMKMECLYNKYGHCKFTSTCRNYHSKEICYEINCERLLCQKRHPKKRRFYEEYGRCKFGEFCSFLHIKKRSFLADQKILDVEDKINELETKVEEKGMEVKALQNKILQFGFDC